jgi:glycolate oxidase
MLNVILGADPEFLGLDWTPTWDLGTLYSMGGIAMGAVEALRRIVSSERVVQSRSGLAAYESDALTAFRTVPSAVVIPESAEEVIAVVRTCRRFGIPFVARGSGTSLSGGSLPVQDGIVIALNRLDRILEVDPVLRIARVQPGVPNLKVSEAAAPHGLYYSPDPSSQQICTIGGNIAFNSGGAHCLKYGMTSNHVLSIKAVLASGEVVEFGSQSLESIETDLRGLFIGNEGLFGVALEIGLRLLPRPQVFHTVLAAYDTAEAAGEAVARIVASGMLPGAMEIMDRLAIDAAEAAVHAGYSPTAQAILIVELEGPAAQVQAEKDRLHEIVSGAGATEIRIAANAAERMAIWKGRKSAFSAVGRLSPDFIVQDGVVPRKRLGEALRRIHDMSKETGIRVANVFHAGDGNLHPLILFDNAQPGALERAEALAGRILKMCIAMGGSITGEHGIGMEKREYMPEMFSDDDLELMRRIRRAFDPDEISNPGKMFPGGEAPALRMTGLHPLERQGVISRE